MANTLIHLSHTLALIKPFNIVIFLLNRVWTSGHYEMLFSTSMSTFSNQPPAMPYKTTSPAKSFVYSRTRAATSGSGKRLNVAWRVVMDHTGVHELHDMQWNSPKTGVGLGQFMSSHMV